MDPYVMSKLTLLKQWPVKKWFNEVKLLLIKQTSNIPLPYQWSSRKHVEAKVQGFKWKKERLDLWTASSKFPHLIVFPLPHFSLLVKQLSFFGREEEWKILKINRGSIKHVQGMYLFINFFYKFKQGCCVVRVLMYQVIKSNFLVTNKP